MGFNNNNLPHATLKDWALCSIIGKTNKKTGNFYCGPWLQEEQVTKPNKSSVMYGRSWVVQSVFGCQVFGQALMEKCDITLVRKVNY